MSDGALEETVLSGSVEHITYSNKQNGYCVFSLKTATETITCVGTVPELHADESLKVHGVYGIHPTYGQQFKVTAYEPLAPEGSAEILRYLSSGAIKGIGPATARKIVERFGSDTLEVIENDYARLSAIRGISLSKAKQISDSYKKQHGIRDVMMQLGRYGITPEQSNKIYGLLGKDCVAKIAENPFVLYHDDLDFSFQRVCDIAAQFHVENDSMGRIRAGMQYILKHNLLNGHTCLPHQKLIELSTSLLQCEESAVLAAYEEMQRDVLLKCVQIDGKDYDFLQRYYTAERYIATKFKIMLDIKPKRLNTPKGFIEALQKKFGIVYEKRQREAINMAVDKGLLVLTGGPGTGKSVTRSCVKSVGLAAWNF